ncbi:MAG: type II secretion system F family protein [Candidatus Aenigmarchaeota archaeon]|nr:type II secretion system F family protein [Candidatus Aenigmarchaeota archaeon]
MKKLTTNQVLLISIGVSAALIIVGLISADSGILGNSIILSTFIIAAPILFVRYKQFRELKEMEEKFPSFLRDLIESIKAGLPLHKAIVNASKINYGSLSSEVNRMANQISWGVPVDKVLRQFSERVKDSKRINASTQVILESYLAGGNVVFTLDTVADSQLKLIDAEKEKESTLGQYTLIMYAVSLVFIVIVVALNKLMVPIFELSAQGSEFGIINPCDACAGLQCGICFLFQGTSSTIFKIDSTSIAAYYISLFFYMSMIQAIFSGLVAGQISEGSMIAGLRHSLILSSITFGTFSILVRLGLLGL